jgi:hypothetical protein
MQYNKQDNKDGSVNIILVTNLFLSFFGPSFNFWGGGQI